MQADGDAVGAFESVRDFVGSRQRSARTAVGGRHYDSTYSFGAVSPHGDGEFIVGREVLSRNGYRIIFHHRRDRKGRISGVKVWGCEGWEWMII